ncbi:MAG: sigma-54 dependent transcriptional regulator [Rhodospirillales bacterium]|nr:sigma-54 dependent transcriptional regulator [Rhodospirillales bacterium]MCW8970601.1 sigma-54 dependent transcriptional regulator [Rhodospirillales bacterium]MCW9001460.1 sigma-54 dependent transcriptional regulator [Rhodospirillales bacterium]MCW9040723.1 sigma-54 dependent transcriptional regulator [Rhodospirillales bacterium]
MNENAMEFDQLFIGESPELLAVLRTAQVAAAADVTVLIQGESGTGKELLAHAIHDHSKRAGGPFVVINCAALPEGLVETELFGHRKGSFTGAERDNLGRIRAAEGGTLFLDEIGELPLSAQAKLLRFLESGECQPVGEARTVQVDTRVAAATNRDLADLVREGRFREDLFYRLNVVPLELPALRERTGDLPLLMAGLTKMFAETHGVEAPTFSREATKILRGYGWPGNIREARNFCERMVVLMGGRVVQPDHLPREISDAVSRPKSSAGYSISLPDGGLNLSELEETLIRQALEKAHGNRSRAARLLGLTRDTMLYRMKKYEIA